MRHFIDVINEAAGLIDVRGKKVPLLTNPTRSTFRQFLETQSVLRACALWDGTLMVFPAMLATHGDIYEDDDQYPLMVTGPNSVEYRFDSSFDPDSVEQMKAEISSRLPHHAGLNRAMGSNFTIAFDESSLSGDEW